MKLDSVRCFPCRGRDEKRGAPAAAGDSEARRRCATSAIGGALVAAILLTAAGCANQGYVKSPAFGATIVDSSGAPLEGVAVLALWPLMGGMEGGNVVGELQMQETLTDAAGHFQFPGWGPMQVPIGAGLRTNDAMLYAFKADYEVAFRIPAAKLPPSSMVERSKWDGTTIAMAFWGVDSPRYREQMDNGGSVTISSIVLRTRDCEWKRMPLMLTRLDAERIRLEGLGVHTYLPSPRSYANQEKCGSASEWLERARQSQSTR